MGLQGERWPCRGAWQIRVLFYSRTSSSGILASVVSGMTLV